MDSSYNKTDHLKLVQLKSALEQNYDIKIIKRLLEEEYDINYAIPDSLENLKSDYIGYTALHLACSYHKTKLFMYLLNQGADFAKTNKAGETVLHKLVKQEYNSRGPLDYFLLNAVLSAHVRTNNICNPCNKDGISHFHIACMTNNSTKAVEFFLDNGISVDESVNMDSTSSGYTPLHFAAERMNTKVVEILLAYGADMHIANASGRTPLHVLIELRMDMFDSKMDVYTFYLSNPRENLQNMIEENEKIINMLLENMSSDKECLDNIGLSNFHVACMLQDTSVAEHLADRVTDIDHCVHKDSKLWPGYTALHFAAHFSNCTVEMLMKKGANIEIQDSKGLTPLDICMERYKIEDICSIMSLNARWKDILFSDGATTLLSFVSTLVETNSFKNFIKYHKKNINNMRIPIEAPLWPGYTLLHLVVLFTYRPNFGGSREEIDDQIIRFCLTQGADLSVQDIHGRTPLHLAFRLDKEAAVDILFRDSRKIPNVSDEDNLTHVHIACGSTDRKLKLKKCLLDNSVVNAVYKGSLRVNYVVLPGSTPLHVCLNDRMHDIDSLNYAVKTLLKHGADPHMKDAYGLTPIHWLLNHFFDSSSANKLFSKVSNDCVAEEYGFSYLHVATQANNYAAVKRLLKNGANVNLAIKGKQRSYNGPLSFLTDYDQRTPLNMLSIGDDKKDVKKLLVKHGADVFATDARGLAPLRFKGTFDDFFPKLLNDSELQNRMRREFGWTKVHLACHMKQIDQFRAVVEAELPNINAQIFSNSPRWETCTPLHILTRIYLDRNYHDVDELTCTSMIKILLENGADVTVMDYKRDTPLSTLFRDRANDGKAYEQAALLMKYHKNFNVNPVNKQGISHFHLACQLDDVDTIKGFLMHGVDVNHPIDYFSDWCPGYTPLHLVSKLEAVGLLVSHGANVHIEAVNGCTVLHEAVRRKNFDQNLIKKIIESGAEINGSNFCGRTPFEEAISYGKITVEKLSFFIRQGFLVNSCNPITGVSYISSMLEKNYKDINLKKTLIEMMMEEESTNIFGRSTIHHLVARWSSSPIDCTALLEKLIRAGHDIDEQDSEGKTALHLAVEFQNKESVKGLLTSGADMNVLNIKGHSALSYIKSARNSSSKKHIEDILSIHACRLILFKLDINQINMDGVRNAHKYIRDAAAHPEFFEQVALTKEIEIGVRSIRLYDFLSETGVISMYPTLNQSERCTIDQYFENFNNEERLKEIRSLLKLQYRKAVKRSNLVVTAMISLRCLLGFQLPDLCAENLFQYLRNSDLQNIIQASNEIEEVKMDVD